MKHFFIKNQIRIALLALGLIMCAEGQAQKKLIHYWDMNATAPAGGAGGVNLSPLSAAYSTFTPGSAYLSFGVPATSYTLDNGTGGSTLNEFHPTTTIVGDTVAPQGNYYIRARAPNTNIPFSWHLPTTNYENLVLTFASELSSAGKGVLSYSYSLNGGTTYSTTGLPITTYTPGTTWGTLSINLSAITGANNNPNFIFVVTNTVVGATGNYRLDNISLQGDSVQVSAKNTSCFGMGSAMATPVVGTAPYTYTWSPSGGNAATASGLSAGNYTVSMTDAYGIVATTTVAVTLPGAPLLANISSVVNVTCFGANTGSAVANVSGGTAGYTYTWSPAGGNAATASGLSGATYTLNVSDANGCTTNTMVTITQPTLVLSASITSTNVACFGSNTGSAAAIVNGGTAGYSYTWSPTGGNAATANGLAQGTYTLVVKDANSCTTNTTVSIAQPTALSAVITSTNVACFGGSTGIATASVSGGTAGYTYTWSPSGGNAATATGLAQGSYTVSIKDANNCTTNTVVTITQPTAALSVSTASVTNVTCFGNNTGSASAIVSGGTAGYTYTWSPSGGNSATASNLTQGSYTINITDANSCITNTTVSITQPASALTASISTAVNGGICSGGSVNATVTVNGGTPAYTYTWLPSGGNTATTNSLTPGNYTVTISDANNCNISSVLTVTAPASALAANITSVSNINCATTNTGSVTATVSGGAPGYTYTWSPSGGNATTATNLAVGNYTLSVTDANGCTTGTVVAITKPVVIISSSNNVNCFGATTGSVTAMVNGGTPAYTYTWSPSGGNAATATGLAAGNYTINITDANSCTSNTVITITQPTASLSAVITSTNVNCFGNNTGAATAVVSGGTSAYTYTWSPSGGNAATAANLTQGSYTVNITDAHNCTTNTVVAITQPAAALTASISASTNVKCNGGSTGTATASVAGGTTAYSYTWSPSGGNTAIGTNLASGNYTLNVSDAKGCTATTSVSITQPATSITASITASNNVTCYGLSNGTATVAATGGVGTYSYTWSNGQTSATASNLSATHSNRLIYYWDMNATLPSTGAGGVTVSPLASEYPTSGRTAHLVFNNGANSILDNGTAGATVNEYPVLGNDSASLAAGNLYIRARNPSYNVPFLWYMPTTNFKNIKLSYAAEISSAGKAVNAYSYSLDSGLTYMTSGILVNGVPATSYTPGLTWGTVTIDLSNIAGANNNPKFVFAITNSVPTATTTSGNARFDNIALQGDTITAGPTYTAIVTDANGCTSNASVTITQPAAALTASITAVTNLKCNGGGTGTATASVTGGTTAYSYTWSPSGGNTTVGTNLAGGNYTLNVSDAKGCTASTTVAITQPASAPTASITGSSNVTCFGLSNGTATVTGSGGASPYTYSWSNGQTSSTATNLSATSTLKLIHYWDMNNTTPVGGAGGINQSPLAAEYSTLGHAYLVFNNGTTSILDNGAGGATVNEFPVLGNDTSGLAADNYFVRARNPSYNVPFNWYMPTTHYKNIVLSYASELSSAGKAISSYAYSLDSGLTFTNAGILVNGLPATSYTAGVTWATVTIDLSNISGINNNPKFVFQVLNSLSTATTTSGNTRFDNIALQGDTINAGPTYTAVVIDANGCTSAPASVTITQPPVLTASVSASTNVTCFGGSTGTATASVNGGNTSYTYTWSPSGGNNASATGLTAGNYTVNVMDNKGCTASNTVAITQPATAVTVSVTSVANVSCNGGSNGTASVTANGGTPAYTYTWAPSGGNTAMGNNLASGTYTLNVTDNKGCAASTTVAVSQPNVMTVSIATFTNVSCNGNSDGAAYAAAIGGSGNYSYQWDDANNQTTATASGLSAGVYNCYVTDVTCNTLATNSVTINEPNLMTASVSGSTSVTCNGHSTGSATVTASLGSGTYTYKWNDANNQTTAIANNLAAGTYTCVVTDVTCGTTVTNTVTITQSSLLTATVSGSTNANCNGNSTGSATVTASLGSGTYTYQWNDGSNQTTAIANNLAAGTYTCMVTDVTCGTTVTNTVVIAQPNALAIDSVKVTTGNNVTVYPSGGIPIGSSASYTYSWTPGGATTATITAATPGATYTVCVTSGYGCGTVCKSILIPVTTGIAAITNNSEVKVYPVPSNGEITVELNEADYQSMKIYDNIGREVYSQLLDASNKINTRRIDLSNQPNSNGIFMLQLITSTGEVVNKRIIVLNN